MSMALIFIHIMILCEVATCSAIEFFPYHRVDILYICVAVHVPAISACLLATLIEALEKCLT